MKVSVKASIVLIAIALVSGFILSVLSDLLYVSEEEKDNRKLATVYASEITERYTSDVLTEKYGDILKNETYGEVTGVYICDDGAVIVKAKGKGGYSSGWVECYVVIKDGVVKNVVVSDNANQSFIGLIKESWLAEQFEGRSTDKELTMNVDVTPNAGASKSSNAINNSVNMAMSFYNKAIKTQQQNPGGNIVTMKAGGNADVSLYGYGTGNGKEVLL